MSEPTKQELINEAYVRGNAFAEEEARRHGARLIRSAEGISLFPQETEPSVVTDQVSVEAACLAAAYEPSDAFSELAKACGFNLSQQVALGQLARRFADERS